MGPDRYKCGHQTLGKRLENSDSNKKYEDISLKIVSLGKRKID
jgi:hypothetical protein